MSDMKKVLSKAQASKKKGEKKEDKEDDKKVLPFWKKK